MTQSGSSDNCERGYRVEKGSKSGGWKQRGQGNCNRSYGPGGEQGGDKGGVWGKKESYGTGDVGKMRTNGDGSRKQIGIGDGGGVMVKRGSGRMTSCKRGK